MFVLGTPIPIKFIHETLFDWVRCLGMKSVDTNENARLHFVYFSYRPDYEYLKLSIESLMNSIADKYIGSVHLFEDQKAPFSNEEISQLKKLCPNLVMQKVENFSWASPESTLAEINCFAKVSEGGNRNDMVVKVDSDILFFKSDKLIRILKSRLSNVGDGHNEHYRFAQGGLYLIRAWLIRDVLAKVTMDEIMQVVKKNDSVGEDKTISRLLKERGHPFFLTRLMLYPSEYQRVVKLNAFNRWDFCSAHFVRDKDNMEQYQKRFSIT